MFEMGFQELVLVAVIGLIVLGPQRLPKVAAELGKWIGKARRTATQLRRQLEREIELSELDNPPPPRTPPSPPPASTGIAPVQAAPESQPPTATEAEAAAHSAEAAAHSPEPTIGAPAQGPADAASADLAREPDSAPRMDKPEKLNS